MFAPETISVEDFKNYDLILISPKFNRLVAVHGHNMYGYNWNNEKETYEFSGWIVHDSNNFLAGKEVEMYT